MVRPTLIPSKLSRLYTTLQEKQGSSTEKEKPRPMTWFFFFGFTHDSAFHLAVGCCLTFEACVLGDDGKAPAMACGKTAPYCGIDRVSA
jgi:hypothetical protein